MSHNMEYMSFCSFQIIGSFGFYLLLHKNKMEGIFHNQLSRY